MSWSVDQVLEHEVQPCVLGLGTVPLRYTLTAQTRFIRTYAYGYTHIRVWLYAHTHMAICTYAYGYTHIRVWLYAHTHIVIRTYAYIYTCIYAYT